MNITAETEARLQILISEDRKIEAIKLLCDTTKCSLRDAKAFVDNYEAGHLAPLSPMSDEELDAQLMNLILQGHKLEAIKLYKDKTHAGLAESKHYIDNLEDESSGTNVTTTGTTNRRETQIDELMDEESGQIITTGHSGTSLLRILFMAVALMLIVGLVMYLFVQ